MTTGPDAHPRFAGHGPRRDVILALAGDTMLGRGVGEHLGRHPARSLFADEVVELCAAADAVFVNLECCISTRGDPAPGRVFHFRAPPKAVEALAVLGVRCVTLANNHALDFGEPALLDTLDHLTDAGIAVVGAGRDLAGARTPAVLDVGGLTLTVVSCTDHPAEYAASDQRPGVAFAELEAGLPQWLRERVRAAAAGGPVLVSPHWGPNMTRQPKSYIRRAADGFVEAGASLVAGHSAHVFHGVAGPVLFDLGDFVDDYATDSLVRNDLGLLWLVSLDAAGPRRLEAVPLHLDFCRTDVARGEDARWIRDRFRQACAMFDTDVTEEDGRLVVPLRA